MKSSKSAHSSYCTLGVTPAQGCLTVIQYKPDFFPPGCLCPLPLCHSPIHELKESNKGQWFQTKPSGTSNNFPRKASVFFHLATEVKGGDENITAAGRDWIGEVSTVVFIVLL